MAVAWSLPGGRVVVCDVYTTTEEQAAEYDRLERLRDPSHVRALRLDELRALVRDAGLAEVSEAFARLPMGLEQSVFLFPPWLVLGAPVLVTGLTTLAAVAPARRAARVDPIEALRQR